jgi:hypothetical protein
MQCISSVSFGHSLPAHPTEAACCSSDIGIIAPRSLYFVAVNIYAPAQLQVDGQLTAAACVSNPSWLA